MIEDGSGWIPGILGWTVAEHGRYYAREWEFGPFFEAKVGAEMAEFLGRLDQPGNRLLWLRDEQGPIATVTLDGGDAEDGLAHLRWFIAAERARGHGAGRRLIARAVAEARDGRARGIYLWTFAGLDAACRVYQGAGFRLTREASDTTWGRAVTEQRWELVF